MRYATSTDTLSYSVKTLLNSSFLYDSYSISCSKPCTSSVSLSFSYWPCFSHKCLEPIKLISTKALIFKSLPRHD